VEDEVRSQARVRTIDKLNEACTNADDRMMRVLMMIAFIINLGEIM